MVSSNGVDAWIVRLDLGHQLWIPALGVDSRWVSFFRIISSPSTLELYEWYQAVQWVLYYHIMTFNACMSFPNLPPPIPESVCNSSKQRSIMPSRSSSFWWRSSNIWVWAKRTLMRCYRWTARLVPLPHRWAARSERKKILVHQSLFLYVISHNKQKLLSQWLSSPPIIYMFTLIATMIRFRFLSIVFRLMTLTPYPLSRSPLG